MDMKPIVPPDISIKRTKNDILRCLTGSIVAADYLQGLKKTRYILCPEYVVSKTPTQND